jgi:hypothetical protein
MDLTFLSPLAFQLLYALPLLLVPYLLRNREKTRIVPALFLYQDLPAASRQRLWGRVQLTPLFFLQLLILMVLIAAAAQPFLHKQGGKVALVLDTSASMQARAPSGSGTIFDLAKQQALQALVTIPSSESVSFFTNTPLPALISTATDNRSELRTVVSHSTPTDAPDLNDDLLSAFFSQLFTEQGFQQVLFFTDRPPTTPSPTSALTIAPFGGAQPNVGIASFRLYRSPFAPEEVDATITLVGADTLKQVQIAIDDADTGKQLVSRVFSAEDTTQFSFARLPLANAYRARIQMENKSADTLALDNEAFAVLPSLTDVAALLVSPSPEAARSLGAIPNLKVERIAPQDYTPAKAAHYAFVLFHLTAPEALPPTSAAFLLPPEGNPLFPLGANITKRVQVTQWAPAHPLTSYVTFSLFSPAYAQALESIGWRQPIVSATVGPIVLAGEQGGKRYLATGFDVLPYLGKSNLPVSIFTLNLLGWLADQAGQPPSFQTGTTLTLAEPAATIRFSTGETVPTSGGMRKLEKQGIYTVNEYGVSRRVAVNLANEQESHLARPLQLTSVAAPAPVAPETTGQPLWPWLLIGGIVLLLLDRWLATRPPALPHPQ